MIRADFKLFHTANQCELALITESTKEILKSDELADQGVLATQQTYPTEKFAARQLFW